MTIGDRIKQAREDRCLTQKDLGKIVGLSVATISKLERDLIDPKVRVVEDMAIVFGYSLPRLLYGPRGFWAWLFGRWPAIEPVKRASAISARVDVPIEEPFPRSDPEGAGHVEQRIAEETSNE